MRLPSLLATQALVFGVAMVRRQIPSLTGAFNTAAAKSSTAAWVLSALGDRALVLVLGLALDLRRRRAFLQERLRLGAQVAGTCSQ